MRWTHAFVVRLGLHVAIILPQTVSLADEIPRYRLVSARSSRYRVTSTSKGEGVTTSRDVQLWPVRLNTDGSWRVICRCTGVLLDDKGKKLPDSTSWTTMEWFDLQPDGRISPTAFTTWETAPASFSRGSRKTLARQPLAGKFTNLSSTMPSSSR